MEERFDNDQVAFMAPAYGGYCCFPFDPHKLIRFAAAINIFFFFFFFLLESEYSSVSGVTSPKIGTRELLQLQKMVQDRSEARFGHEPLKYIANQLRVLLRSDSNSSLDFDSEGIGMCLVQIPKLYYADAHVRQRSAWVNYLNGGHWG